MQAAPGRARRVGGADGAIAIRDAEPADVPLLLKLFGELADYEHLRDELRATPEQLQSALFGEHPLAETLIAEHAGEPAGYALFFPTFSSFLAREGSWLEDLFVRPAHRGAGVGRALLAAVAARVHERGGARLGWAALDWNELALGFFARLGGGRTRGGMAQRPGGEELAALAREGAMHVRQRDS